MAFQQRISKEYTDHKIVYKFNRDWHDGPKPCLDKFWRERYELNEWPFRRAGVGDRFMFVRDG